MSEDEKRGRARSYDLIESRTIRERKTDPLEEAIESEDRELGREAKRKRLEEITLERELRIKELKKRMGTEAGSSISNQPMTTGALVTTLIQSGVDPKAASEWLKGLDPQALGALIALQSNNPALAALAFGMGQRGQGITVKDVVDLNKAMFETGKAGQPAITIDIPKLIEAVKSGGPSISPKEIVDSTVGAIQTGIQLATPKGKEEQGWFEKLMSSPEGVQTAKEVGLFGGQLDSLKLMKEIKDSDRRFMKEMKESDRRWQLQMMKYRDDSRRAWAETQEKRRRTQLAEGALKRVGRAIARAVSEGEEEEGEEEAGEAKPAKTTKVKQYKCSDCGAPISVPPDIKPGAIVTCASCGAQYEAEATKS